MSCIVCASELTPLRKKYNKHVMSFSVKSLIKELLPHFDFIIPKSIPKLKKVSSNKSDLFKGYVHICSNCGHGIMEKPPTESELHRYYQKLYWSERFTVVDRAFSQNDQYKDDLRANHQINFVLEQVPCNKITSILEIGAGSASASLLLRDKCNNSLVKLYACEPGQQWEDFYRNQGIEKIADYFPFETDKSFDYVHTSHWLEHVLDLDETLLELYYIINSLGCIFVEVPNTEHYYWDLSTGDTPHIHFFTRKSLVRAFKNQGFECLSIGEYGITFLESMKGLSVTSERHGVCEKGFWIRALFKKVD